MRGPIYMYYRLTNFYQNHRQYIKNYDPDQLLGKRVASNTLHTNCDPLASSNTGKVIYPCGLIANSMFNDTVSNFTSIGDPSVTYNMSSQNIAWPSDKRKYAATEYSIADVVPPPNWSKRYPNSSYTPEYPPPNLTQDEHFMVWMHVAALPDFRKIWGRNDNSDLTAGRWRVTLDMNFDTLQYGGTKWLVLSTTTPLGGRNPYLGIAYIAIGAICIFIGILFSLRQLIKPRKLGDESYLSWNQPGGGLPKNKKAIRNMKTSFLLSLWILSGVFALQDYCKTGFKPFADKALQLDLNKLNQDFIVFQNESVFPSTKSTVTQINLCDGLTIPKEDKISQDNCLQGTYVCQRLVYSKNNKEDVVEIHNIAGDYEKSKLRPEFKAVKPDDDSKAILYGENDQSANIMLECDTSKSREEKAGNPSIVYDEGKKQPDVGNGGDGGNDEKKKEGRTVVGILFTS
ncbi:ligand-effect modulator 3 family [Sporodiniella umbellata]|nr:ligand-effect modulator 3 family [Sporodiniella umbellata]